MNLYKMFREYTYNIGNTSYKAIKGLFDNEIQL